MKSLSIGKPALKSSVVYQIIAALLNYPNTRIESQIIKEHRSS
jgi:hypothetical protein